MLLTITACGADEDDDNMQLDEGPLVIISSSSLTVSEGDGSFDFTISINTFNTGDPIDVDYTVGGTATEGTDYQPLSNTATIPGGGGVGITFNPSIVDDTQVEGNETVILTLIDGEGYQLSGQSSITFTINDND